MRAPLAGLALVAIVGTAEAAGDRELGEYLFGECTACHQASGRQTGAIPAIIGWPEDQFIAIMDAYRSKMRENQVMQTIAARLSAEEVAALAAYLTTLKPVP